MSPCRPQRQDRATSVPRGCSQPRGCLLLPCPCFAPCAPASRPAFPKPALSSARFLAAPRRVHHPHEPLGASHAAAHPALGQTHPSSAAAAEHPGSRAHRAGRQPPADGRSQAHPESSPYDQAHHHGQAGHHALDDPRGGQDHRPPSGHFSGGPGHHPACLRGVGQRRGQRGPGDGHQR